MRFLVGYKIKRGRTQQPVLSFRRTTAAGELWLLQCLPSPHLCLPWDSLLPSSPLGSAGWALQKNMKNLTPLTSWKQISVPRSPHPQELKASSLVQPWYLHPWQPPKTIQHFQAKIRECLPWLGDLTPRLPPGKANQMLSGLQMSLYIPQPG